LWPSFDDNDGGCKNSNTDGYGGSGYKKSSTNDYESGKKLRTPMNTVEVVAMKNPALATITVATTCPAAMMTMAVAAGRKLMTTVEGTTSLAPTSILPVQAGTTPTTTRTYQERNNRCGS
jgi:hypothetical protein